MTIFESMEEAFNESLVRERKKIEKFKDFQFYDLRKFTLDFFNNADVKDIISTFNISQIDIREAVKNGSVRKYSQWSQFDNLFRWRNGQDITNGTDTIEEAVGLLLGIIHEFKSEFAPILKVEVISGTPLPALSALERIISRLFKLLKNLSIKFINNNYEIVVANDSSLRSLIKTATEWLEQLKSFSGNQDEQKIVNELKVDLGAFIKNAEKALSDGSINIKNTIDAIKDLGIKSLKFLPKIATEIGVGLAVAKITGYLN